MYRQFYSRSVPRPGFELLILVYVSFTASADQPGVHEINGICIPQAPANQAGYPIFREHARDRFFVAGYGRRGYTIRGVPETEWRELTPLNYADICEVFYVNQALHDTDDRNSKFIKLRHMEVSLIRITSQSSTSSS